MLTVSELMNPKHRDKASSMKIPERTPLQELKLEELLTVSSEYIHVVDEKKKVIGAIKTERLCYLIRKREEVPLAQILDFLDVGIVAIDSDSRIFYVNPAYGRILGVEIAKVLGRYMSLIEPDAALLDTLKTGQEKVIETQLIKTVNTYVSTKISPIKTGNQVAGAFSIFTDVTQLNQLHREVRRISQVAEEYNRRIEAKEILERNHVAGKSKAYFDCIEKAIKVAQTDAVVLLRGENGVGKEVITRIIQQNSLRAEKAFITVNCSAIPESLIESELFGYEEGAFTGASKGGKLGKFQLADGGTLFLDEIGDMPYPMQAKLLRVLQEGEIEKVGRQDNIPVNVRVIAATNKPLEKMVEDGKFREDLYYRLNVINILVPPLRERGNDVLLLADHFLQKYNKQYKRKAIIDKSVYQRFLEYSWPGNVRELKNAIESAVVLCNDDQIKLSDLPEAIEGTNNDNNRSKPASFSLTKEMSLREATLAFERQMILSVLDENQGDKGKTMEQLKISKRSFYRKIASFGTEQE